MEVMIMVAILIALFSTLPLAAQSQVADVYHTYPPLVVGEVYSGDIRPTITLQASDDARLPDLLCLPNQPLPEGLVIADGCKFIGTPKVAGDWKVVLNVLNRTKQERFETRVHFKVRGKEPLLNTGSIYWWPPNSFGAEVGVIRPGKLMRMYTDEGPFLWDGGYFEDFNNCSATGFGVVQVLLSGKPIAVCHVSFSTMYVRIPDDVEGDKADLKVVTSDSFGKRVESNLASYPVKR